MRQIPEVRMNNNLRSISPTFYARLFRMKVSRAALLYLHFRLVPFWHKNIGVQADHKMLVKLSHGINYTNFQKEDFALDIIFTFLLDKLNEKLGPVPICEQFSW